MKLISMIDYVLEQDENTVKFMNDHDNKSIAFSNVLNYANFLKQPLTLGMFIPCDEDGNVLEKPQLEYPASSSMIDREHNKLDIEQYQQAEEKVLFSCEYGWEMSDIVDYLTSDGVFKLDEITIGDINLIWDECEITLTQTAIKQLVL